MGQRSQMYIIIKEKGEYAMCANYYGWNYGERLISRSRYSLEYILEMKKSGILHTYFKNKLKRIMDVNFDMMDVVESSDIVNEFFEDYYDEYVKENENEASFADCFWDYCFSTQDNNDGQMYLYIDLDADVFIPKMCFLSGTLMDEENTRVMSADSYLINNLCYGEDFKTWQEYMEDSDYYGKREIAYTKANVDFINENTELLLKQELLDVTRKVAEYYAETKNNIRERIIRVYE